MIVPASPPPQFVPTIVVRQEVVTLTVTSGSATSTSNPSSGGGSASVPIGAIAGGVAGGVTLAVVVVLIWKYWGVLIKRDERKKRKEAQDMITVRENTRRNASSGFKPQSQYRPMLALNPDRRRVKFLTRTPTASRKKQQQHRAPSPVPAGSEGKQGRGGTEAQAPSLTPAPTAEEGETRQPSSPSLPFTPGATSRSQDTNERLPENNDGPQAESSQAHTLPTVSDYSYSHARTPMDTAPATYPPVPRVHIQGPSPPPMAHPPVPSGSSSSHGQAHAPTVPAPGGSQSPPVSTAAPPLPVGAAPPTLAALSAPTEPSPWAPAGRFSLKSSVLPTSPDRPVILPRPKHAPWTPAPPASSSSSSSSQPASARPHVPRSARNSAEPMTRRGFLNAMRHKTSPLGSGSVNAHSDDD